MIVMVSYGGKLWIVLVVMVTGSLQYNLQVNGSNLASVLLLLPAADDGVMGGWMVMTGVVLDG